MRRARNVGLLLLHTSTLVLFATLAFAALHNVTVDDSVLTGAVVPRYLPSVGAWSQGNTCQDCAAQPDPAMAYNGTWHDASFSLLSGPFLSFEFSFVGSALYIYFILANAPNFFLLNAVTSVNFTLDGVTHPPFVHFPTPGAGYKYHVPVFANAALPSGTHTMTVKPVVPTTALNDSVLMLFDYLVYTTDANNVTTATTPTITTLSPIPGSSSTSTGMAPVQNIGAIVGGTVAGVIVFVLVAVSLLCYRRYKRRIAHSSPITEPILMDPFASPRITPSNVGSSSPPVYHRTSIGFSPTEFGSRSNASASSLTVQPTTPSVTPPVSDATSSSVTALMEQIGLLRNEVSRMREHQVEFGSEPPPEYSGDSPALM